MSSSSEEEECSPLDLCMKKLNDDGLSCEDLLSGKIVPPVTDVNEGIILALMRVKEDNKLDNTALCTWILRLCGRSTVIAAKDQKCVASSLQRLKEKLKNLLKSRSRSTGSAEYHSFLDSSYTLPPSLTNLPAAASSATTSTSVATESVSEGSEADHATKKHNMSDLEARVQKAQDKLRNVHKKLSRRD